MFIFDQTSLSQALPKGIASEAFPSSTHVQQSQSNRDILPTHQQIGEKLSDINPLGELYKQFIDIYDTTDTFSLIVSCLMTYQPLWNPYAPLLSFGNILLEKYIGRLILCHKLVYDQRSIYSNCRLPITSVFLHLHDQLPKQLSLPWLEHTAVWCELCMYIA